MRNDGSPLQSGDLYFSTTTNMVRAYDGDQWVDSVVPASVSIAVQKFSGDGAALTFPLNPAPPFAAACDVAISGATQTLGDDFTVAGTVLTFTSAPPAGTTVYVKVTSAVVGSVPPDGSVTSEKLASLIDLGSIV